MREEWVENSYRRTLIDMHIADWDEKFLSRFRPEEYVDAVASAQVRSCLFYANSHIGNCYWPTRTGHMHRGLKGRDILGEVIDLCHHRDIDLIVYYSLIFNNWASENHPDWRMITPEGKEGKGLGRNRYGICCPNSPYRDFAIEQIQELCKGYDFEGFWFDMTFWLVVCYCDHCQRRYSEEVGREIPTIVNWEDPQWVSFQRKREEWLAEFAASITGAAKKFKPGVSVTHQCAAFIKDWRWAASLALADANDYMAADFYGDSLQQSFFSKLFSVLSRRVPFEFMISRCIGLRDHTTTKPQELLEAHAYSALANNAAFLFIDAIDPLGTFSEDIYGKMGGIFQETRQYEKYLGGEPHQDVVIYFSPTANIDLEGNNQRVKEASFGTPHLDAALCVSRSLLEEHILFGVITKKNLRDLPKDRVLILPALLAVDEEEVGILKDFVASGGSLYVSKYTSLITNEGLRKDDFLLSDLFGVSYLGETEEKVTYIAPTKDKEKIFLPHSAKYPLTVFDTQLKVEARKGAKILATITLPYTDPEDETRFASIHSNPPGIPTSYPAVVLNKYGKGKVIYVAADLEAIEYHPHRLLFTNLIRLLSPKGFFLKADAPKAVEITVFHQEDRGRYLINLLNFQSQLPNIPVQGIRVRMRLDQRRPDRLVRFPQEKDLPFENRDGWVEFVTPKLETFLMLGLYYQ